MVTLIVARSGSSLMVIVHLARGHQVADAPPSAWPTSDTITDVEHHDAEYDGIHSFGSGWGSLAEF